MQPRRTLPSAPFITTKPAPSSQNPFNPASNIDNENDHGDDDARPATVEYQHTEVYMKNVSKWGVLIRGCILSAVEAT